MEYAPGLESAASNGDYVGVESSIDLRNGEEFEEYVRDCEMSYDRRKVEVALGIGVVGKRRRRMTEVRVFPPPITLLARTENQQSHMPLVMKRYYTDDGRLVIKEEKVIHRDHFHAHRAHGRLTLELIPCSHRILYDAQLNNNNHTEFVNELKEEVFLEVNSLDEDTKVMNEKAKEKEEAVARRVMVTSVSMGVKSCEVLTSASSLFHLQVRAIRPVIS